MAEMRTVTTLGQQVTYCLERKQVKNVNLRIRKDGSVWVSADKRFPAERIDAFVISRGEMILRARAQYDALDRRSQQPSQAVTGETLTLLGQTYRLRVVQSAREGVALAVGEAVLSVRDVNDARNRQRVLRRFMLDFCRQVYRTSLLRQLPLLAAWNVPEPAMKVVDTRSRWGSCNRTKQVIHLSRRLIAAPLRCVDYVVLHELCHFVHFDHSPAFHRLMTQLMPDWQTRRKELNCIV